MTYERGTDFAFAAVGALIAALLVAALLRPVAPVVPDDPRVQAMIQAYEEIGVAPTAPAILPAA